MGKRVFKVILGQMHVYRLSVVPGANPNESVGICVVSSL